jgi:membrane-associated phospholipid phosphatase
VSNRIFIYGSFLPALIVLFTYTAHGEELQNPQDPSATAAAAGSPQVVSPGITRTESVAELGPRSFLRSFGDDQKHIWTSPSRIFGRDWKWIVPLIVGTGVAIATDNRLTEELPNPDDPAKIAGTQVSRLGALYTVAGISAGTYLVGRVAGKDRLRDTGWLGLEALAHTQIVVQASKLVTQRERPPDPKPRRGFWTGGSSFPSGHAATTWAWATVVARQYPEKKIVPVAVYSLAAVVSAARLSARRHYASDILVGGAIGHLIGRYIHRSHTATSSQVTRALLERPRVGIRYSRPARQYALNLSWAF